METIFGLFEEREQAEAALKDLLARGFEGRSMNAIGLQATARNWIDSGQERARHGKSGEELEGAEHPVERMLRGEQGVPVPDVGQLVAGGELATIMANTAAQPGAADGGLRTALIDFGVSPEAAEAYRAGVRSGGLLFFVRVADEGAGEAAEIMREHGSKQVQGFA